MLPSHTKHGAVGCTAEQGANTKDGSVDCSSEVQCVDVGAIFDGQNDTVPAQTPLTLKRKFASVSLSVLAVCALFFDGSSPSTRPELARRLLGNSTLFDVDAQNPRDGCTWMYYNPDDPELFIGTNELRRSFIR